MQHLAAKTVNRVAEVIGNFEKQVKLCQQVIVHPAVYIGLDPHGGDGHPGKDGIKYESAEHFMFRSKDHSDPNEAWDEFLKYFMENTDRVCGDHPEQFILFWRRYPTLNTSNDFDIGEEKHRVYARFSLAKGANGTDNG